MISVYKFKENNVRIITIDDVIWFVAIDVGDSLGYADPSMMLKHVDDIDKQTINPHKLDPVSATETFGSNTFRVSVINESGLYAAIFGSSKSQAKDFKKWVTSEVLPSVRKTGVYGLQNLSKLDILEMALESEKNYLAEQKARQLAEQHAKLLQGVATELRQEVEHLEEVIEEEAHLVHLSQTLTVRDKDVVTIGELSQSYQVVNYEGRNKFFRLLREIKFLQQNVNRPYQTHIDAGRAEVYRKERDNQPGIFDPVTVVTAKGQEYLAKKIREFELYNRVEGQVERIALAPGDF
jgi:prophage antirepressor-like protein